MKKTSYIKFLALMAASVATMTSCADSDPAISGENADANVIFTVKATPSSPQSRNTTWDDPNLEQPGNGGNDGVDNVINSLQIAIYNPTDNRLIGNVTNLIMLKQDADGTRHYVGKLPVQADGTDIIEKDKEYRVMVFANCSDIADFSNPASLTFDRPDPPTHEVKMWGVKNPVKFTLDKEVAQQIGSINLLRTMSRVEVRLSDELKNQGYRLSKPTVININPKGNILPSGWDTAKETNNISYEGAINVTGITGDKGVAPLTQFSTEEYWRAYIPDIENVAPNRPQINLLIQQTQGTSTTVVGNYTLQFGNYTNGAFSNTYFNVVRNHIYRYTITGIGASGNITLTVDPWEDNNTTEWDYSNTVGINQGDHIQWTAGTYSSLSSEQARLVMNSNRTPAECHFRFSSPVGATWYASLIPGENTAADDFEFVDAAGNTITAPSGEIIKENPDKETLRIRPTKDPDAYNARSVILRIVVRTPDGEPVTVNLLEPDKYGDNTEFTLVQNPTM